MESLILQTHLVFGLGTVPRLFRLSLMSAGPWSSGLRLLDHVYVEYHYYFFIFTKYLLYARRVHWRNIHPRVHTSSAWRHIKLASGLTTKYRECTRTGLGMGGCYRQHSALTVGEPLCPDLL